jgi:hypothetical protein
MLQHGTVPSAGSESEADHKGCLRSWWLRSWDWFLTSLCLLFLLFRNKVNLRVVEGAMS